MKNKFSLEVIVGVVGIVIAIVLGLPIIVAEVYFRKEERPFWVWLTLILLGVALVILITGLIAYWIIQNRRCMIARNFKEYCVKCERMLKKSGTHGNVMTIQTPIGEIPADAQIAFQSYIDLPPLAAQNLG
jgi:energy-converting hydrogenase Eha subunit A